MNNTLQGWFDYCLTDAGGIGLTMNLNGVFYSDSMIQFGIDRLALGTSNGNILAHVVYFNPSKVMATAVQFIE